MYAAACLPAASQRRCRFRLKSRQLDALKVKINISNFAAAIQNNRNNIDSLIHKEWQSQQDPQELNLNDNTQSGPSTSKKRRFFEKVDPIPNLRICKEICDTIVVQANEHFGFTTHLTIASLFDSEKFKDYRVCFPNEDVKTKLSPSDILPLPIVMPKTLQKAEKRRRGKTAIITSSPYLLELKENLDKPTSKAVKSVKRKLCEEHNAKNRPKKSRKSRKISTYSESFTEEPTNYCQDVDSEESMSLDTIDITALDKDNENEFTLIHKDIDTGDF
ncbi:unnamed protein product [Psylliodes chrysocephalus]|uniref:Uncharacterized protein n=1 Tax=Psylliodes chrysocephalus TaxID=3402493 RepID=A0A9P0D9L4_9CUCU|nr:unnamed protein product [Psylliodes chrysocephala]